ncbi:MAG: enoyl-CoA hydratase/isomerase family protein, partial [Proteobacteria bacterium]|nr:enoyl-CoA hydratase/isomerase family protein [Pseudomonadota bacterium]
MNLANFKWDQDDDGIVTLTWDMPDKPVNLLSLSAVEDIAKAADAIAKDERVRGVVIVSAKKGNFCAGADLDEMAAHASGGAKSMKAAFELMTSVHK